MNAIKTVSSKFARRDFQTIGLVLILYALISLFVPLVLVYFADVYKFTLPMKIDTELAIRMVCLLTGTVLPFVLLDSMTKKREHEPVSFGLLEFMADFIVFFTMFSGSLFLAHSLAIRFSLKGNIIAAIGFSLMDDQLFKLPYVLSYVVIIPLIEEFAYRGVLLRTLSRYGKYFALLTTSILYALAHASLVEMIPAFAMAYLLGKVSLKYRSIRPVVGLHIAVNALLYIIFITPTPLMVYAYSLLAFIYVVAGYLMISRTYMSIRVRKTSSSLVALSMFFSTSSVVMVLFLFVVSTVLSFIL